MVRKTTTTVPAKPSATVVMLRNGSQNPELLLVKRRSGDAFGESYAFPGGVVDHDESASFPYCEGITDNDANAMMSVPNGGLDYYVATIRELFEETGVLLARDASGAWATHNDSGIRKDIVDGTLPWSEFLRERGLCMACDVLHYFAHWETPLSEPKRWSARFFLARMPSGQDARHDGTEITDSRWLNAAEALEIRRQGRMKMPFPTYRSLRIFSEFSSVDGLIDWAQKKNLQGVPKFRPMQINVKGEVKYVIPGDAEYPEGGDGEE